MNNIFVLLFLIFLVLKLVGVIAWSWFWVFSPLLAMLVIVIPVLMLAAWAQGNSK